MATITFGKIPVLWGIKSRIRKPKHLKQQGGDLSEWTSRVPFTKITAAIEKAYVNFILSINKWVLICYIYYNRCASKYPLLLTKNGVGREKLCFTLGWFIKKSHHLCRWFKKKNPASAGLFLLTYLTAPLLHQNHLLANVYVVAA